MRIEEKTIPIVKNPVGVGKSKLALLNRVFPDVQAPIIFLVNRGGRIAQDVAYVSAEIEYPLPSPIRITNLLGEIGKLP